ncbi:MAG: aspartate aminotransferase family protein [Deltaproteobacteria bacterium]|nr:aspartate aminotransferase family protein [Deltaproteobacteria bacterium]
MKRLTATPSVKVAPPGPNARKWAEFHKKYAAFSTYFYPFIWDRAAPATGPFVTDVDGNVIMDFVSHVASSPLGYNHPTLTAISKKLAAIDPDRYAGTDFVGGYGPDPDASEVPTPSHLHHELIDITSKFGFGTAFLSNSGAEAVENAIKICYDYKRNFGYGVCFMGAFHGRTLGALSLNRSKQAHRVWYPKLPHVIDMPFCICRGKCTCGWQVLTPRSGVSMSKLAFTLDPEMGLVDPKEVAYIIIEPVQGEGGYNIPAKAFIQEVARVAKEHHIPLICDEIQSGLGRTGKWWAIEHFDVEPDIITVAKSLRVGATIGKSEFFPQAERRISSTWGEGNAISTAVGYTIIQIIKEENLLQNATVMGNYFLDGLKSLMTRYPSIISARGLGLMLAVTPETKELQDKILKNTFARGLLLLGCGYRDIRFLPPLDVTRREIDLSLEILDAAIAAAQG